jgi:raffinose/stachyose/melibiose transport system permease protein
VKRKKSRRPSIGSLIVLVIAIVVVGIPFWVILVNSFKPYSETIEPGLGLPMVWRIITNYVTVLRQSSVLTGFLNTTLILVGTIPLTLLLSSAAAWVFARSKSRPLQLMYYAMLAGVVVPPALVASIFVLKAFGVYGGLPGLSLLYCSWFIPLGVFLITGFVRTLPLELEEAARMDGAGSLTVFTRIVLPLLTPVLITTSLIVVIGLWSDYLTPFLFLNDPSNNTLTLSLFDFSVGSTVADNYQWNLVFADIVLTSLPMLIVYFLSQRFIVYGLSGVGK